jgi:hypothetical protein
MSSEEEYNVYDDESFEVRNSIGLVGALLFHFY